MHMLHRVAARFLRAVRVSKGVTYALSLIGLTVLVLSSTLAFAGGTVSEIDRPATATAQAQRLRTFLIGDSITIEECPLLPSYICHAYYGGWVASQDGTNLVDGFVTIAGLRPGDTVFMSNISAWTTNGNEPCPPQPIPPPESAPVCVDNKVILQRLDDLYTRLMLLGVNLVMMVAPAPNFALCMLPFEQLTIAQQKLIGPKEHFTVACGTQGLIREKEMSWPVPHLTIAGPYVADSIHLTDEGKQIMADKIAYFMANGVVPPG